MKTQARRLTDDEFARVMVEQVTHLVRLHGLYAAEVHSAWMDYKNVFGVAASFPELDWRHGARMYGIRRIKARNVPRHAYSVAMQILAGAHRYDRFRTPHIKPPRVAPPNPRSRGRRPKVRRRAVG